jgi:hypothetical protein
VSVGTSALQLPREPRRRRLQVGLLDRRVVAEIVREHGRVDYLIGTLELADRHRISTGAALAAVRRAVIRGDVRVDGSDLILPGAGGTAA